jgi:hypothetical protein
VTGAQERIDAAWQEAHDAAVDASTNGQHADVDLVTGTPKVTFPPEVHLPDAFWNVQTDGPLGDRLRHIRQAAYAQQRNPTAVLYTVFSRIGAGLPHTIKIDDYIGTEQPLSVYVSIIGPSGGGKSDAATIGARQLPTAQLPLLKDRDGLPPGSGEGFVDAMFELEDVETGGTTKNGLAATKKMNVQRHYNAFFVMDEGEAFAKLAGKSGSTLRETVRLTWSGKVAGQTNTKSGERLRLLPAGNYTYGLVIILTPGKAATIIDDDEGGTPQRFLWAPSTGDTTSPRPARVGPLDWVPPGPPRLELIKTLPSASGEFVRHYLTQDPAIEEEMEAYDQDIQNQQLILDSLDSHRLNMRRRIAGHLTILDESFHVGVSHWALAEMVMAASDATRAVVTAFTRTLAAQCEAQTRNRISGREVAKLEAVEQNDTMKCARIIGDKSWAEPERWTVKKMREGPCNRFRPVFEQALRHAIDSGWVIEDEIEVDRATKGGAPRGPTRKRALRPGSTRP